MKLLKSIFLTMIMGFIPSFVRAQGYARFQGDTLKIGNSMIERVFLWNAGNLKTLRIVNKQNGHILHAMGKDPDILIVKGNASEGTLERKDIPADGIHPSYHQVIVSYRIGRLWIRRCFNIYANTPAILCNTYLKGTLSPFEQEEKTSGADRKNIEFASDVQGSVKVPVLEGFSLNGFHWKSRAVEFYDYTDWNDNLVIERDFIPFRENFYRGNLLFCNNLLSSDGFFILKEAPCSSTQLEYPGYDFKVEFSSFKVAGLGVRPSDITPDRWTRAYGVVLGIYTGKEREGLMALRCYQKMARYQKREEDEMIMLNTWGDRSQDSKITESFCLSELDKANRLGITVFQLDDGWQIGKSPNSKVAKGSFKDIWKNQDYWKPDPVKFPNGLHPLVKKAKKMGIRIGLWFNPSIQNDFADWQRDADAILSLWKEYGITIFKIDGLQIPNKRAEENLRHLFNKVVNESHREIIFNLDATAGRRGGYHMFNEYGNIFMENRYTDWGNYYPFRTLRNLWQLSKYVPAERIQVEFLNKWRNADKYPSDDVFAPSHYSFEYLFAITMSGQPLAWMEASNLPEEAFSIGSFIKKYQRLQPDFHRGVILPIGEEPSGRSWTGFQSVHERENGYLLIFREDNERKSGRIKTWLTPGSQYSLYPIAGNGEQREIWVDEEGYSSFTLPDKNEFTLYQYKLQH